MQGMSVSGRRADWAERLAVGASLTCLVHCLGLPLLLAALPALSSALPIPESFHWWVLGIAVPAAVGALFHGRARHRRAWPLAIGVVGLCLLAGGALLGEGSGEIALTVLGSLTVAGAHIANWRMRHACC